MNYTQQLLQAFIEGMVQEKAYRGWTVRPNGLIEDCTGNVKAVDLVVTDNEVKIALKSVPVL